MEKILQSLHDLEGVNGTLITDPSGNILASNAHSMYDTSVLQQVSRSVVAALDSVKLVHEEWETVTAQFSEGRLLLRNLGSGARGKASALTLCVIADSRLNPSFASVAIRVAVGKLRTHFEANGAPSNASSTTVKSGSFESQSAVQVAVKPAPTEVASSGLSWSGIGSASSMSASGVAVTDADSAVMLTNCTKALARSVGPIAKIFVKEAVRRLFADQPFSKDQTKRLVAELSKHIDAPNDAAQFQKSILSTLAS